LIFLAFAKAFWLYRQNRDNGTKKDIKPEIDEIKNSMNSKRTNFDRANCHKFEITRSWLLGFTEGDGSFYYDRSCFAGKLEISTNSKRGWGFNERYTSLFKGFSSARSVN
jgi:hypothetical protein